MKRQSFDIYSEMPKAMKRYLSVNGWHFNKAASEFAAKRMKKEGGGSIAPYEKKQVEELLKKYGVQIENDLGYDAVYVANMCRADHLRGSVTDEAHMAMYIKETLDDPDGSDGDVMYCWYNKMERAGVPIDWDGFLDE